MKGISDGVVFCHLIFQGNPCFRAYHINKRDERFAHLYAPNGALGTDKKAFAERAAAERNSAFNGGLGALPSTSSLWQMDSHKHCLPETKTVVMLLVSLHKIVYNSNIRR